VPCLWFEFFFFLHFPGTATCRGFFLLVARRTPRPLVQRSIPLRPRGALRLLGRLVGSVRVKTRRRLLVWVAQSSMQFAQQVRDPLRYCFGNLGSCGQLAGHSCLDFFDDYALARRLQGRPCAVSTGHSSTRERQIPDTTPETVLSFQKRGALAIPPAPLRMQLRPGLSGCSGLRHHLDPCFGTTLHKPPPQPHATRCKVRSCKSRRRL
jgi:hypothetical protein